MRDYVKAAVDFLRGETGHVLMYGHRSWLPEGTTFPRVNREEIEKTRERMRRGIDAGEWTSVRAYADELAKGRIGEPTIKAVKGNDDASQWYNGTPEELGQRFLLVAIRGEAAMWCTTYPSGSDMACAIVDLIADRDNGFAAAVDLETGQLLRYTASVTLDPLPVGEDWNPPEKSAP